MGRQLRRDKVRRLCDEEAEAIRPRITGGVRDQLIRGNPTATCAFTAGANGQFLHKVVGAIPIPFH